MSAEQKPQRNLDAILLERFIDSAMAGRPQGYRRDTLREALRRLEEQLEAAQHERSVATSWAAELAGENRALQASVEIIQQERDDLRSFLTEVTWHEDIEGNSALGADDFEKLRRLLFGDSIPAMKPDGA